MSYEELREPLRKLSKAELVEYLASVVNLLTGSPLSLSFYGMGWYDSRRAVMDITGLNELYGIQPLEQA